MTSEDNYQRARQIIAILNEKGFPSRLVGGCVRDRVLGIAPLDYDIATTATPEHVQQIFTELPSPRIKVIPTGLAHGTVTLVHERQPFQVTTLRHDIATDGRRATVSFAATSFEADAARRDFTINAMSEDVDGTIYDYFSGREDLRHKKIRFIGSPEQRIKEDYLRIMRFFRFKARFSLHSDPATDQAVAALAPGLAQVSRERITMELWSLLSQDHVMPIVQEMAAANIFAVILPELAPVLTVKELRRLAALEPALRTIAPGMRSAAHLASWWWMAGSSDPLRVGAQLVLSNKQLACVCWSVQGFSLLSSLGRSQSAVFAHLDLCDSQVGKGMFLPYLLQLWRGLAALLGKEDATVVLKNLARLEEAEKHKRPLRVQFPLNGKDIAQWTGISAGPRLGKILAQLKESYRNEEWRTREEAMARACELAADDTSSAD